MCTVEHVHVGKKTQHIAALEVACAGSAGGAGGRRRLRVEESVVAAAAGRGGLLGGDVEEGCARE